MRKALRKAWAPYACGDADISGVQHHEVSRLDLVVGVGGCLKEIAAHKPLYLRYEPVGPLPVAGVPSDGSMKAQAASLMPRAEGLRTASSTPMASNSA